MMPQKVTTATVADTVLARICTFDVNELKSFIFEDGKKSLLELDQLNYELNDVREKMITLLYETIPDVENKKVSRAMIDLKRRIYNKKNIPLQKIIDVHMDEYFVPEDQRTFQRWFTLEKKKKKREEEFLHLYKKHKDYEEELIYQRFQLKEHDFFKGLPVVNQKFSNFLTTRERKHWKIGSNLVKSSYSYFLRGTVKTSPLSTFTQLTTTTYEKDNVKHTNKNRFKIAWSRALVTTVFEYLATIPEFKPLLSYRVTEKINRTEGNGVSQRVRGHYSTANQLFSKTEEVIRYNQELPQLDELGDVIYPYEQLVQKINHPYVEDYIKYVLDQKLIRPVMPFEIEDTTPFLTLIQYIKEQDQYEETIHGEFCSILREMEGLKDELAYQLTFHHRNQTLKRLKEKVNELFQSLGSESPSWIGHLPIIYEDVRSTAAIPPIGRYVKEDIEKLQGFLQNFYYSHSLYEKLLNVFKERVGVGGEVNLMTFLSDILESEVFYSTLMSEARIEEIKKVMNRNTLEEKFRHIPKTNTIYYQLAASSYDDVVKGDYLFIVNKVTDGSGNIFTRFNHLFENEMYRDRLRSWMEDLYQDIPIYQVTFGEDWSNLQEKYGMLQNELNWVGELSSVSKYDNVCVNELILRHDEAADRFTIHLKNGKRIQPVYLGSVPEHMTNDLSRLFVTLMKPYFIHTPFGAHPFNQPHVKDEIIHFPRKQVGRIVLNREQWAMPKTIIQELFEQSSDAALMEALHKFRIQHGIPEEVFITMSSNSQTVFNHEKPFWFHFYNILSVDMLKKALSSQNDNIIFVEALPGLHEQWFEDDKKRYTTEYMTLGAIY